MTVYQLYYRDNCHLCEDMISQLRILLNDYEQVRLELRNVDTDPGWLENYSSRVPVLLHQEQVLSEYFLDQETVRQHLNGQQG